MALNRNCLCGCEGAGEAELGDLTNEPVCLDLGRGTVEVVGSQVLIERAVAEHVVGGGQDRGSDGTDGLFGSSPVAQALELGLQIAALLVAGGPGALHERGLQPRRALAQPRLPALSSLRGHRPAHEIRCPAVGKRLISVPISETMTCAVRSLTPGMVRNWRTA